MKILVTGCMGFIGSNLCIKLLNAGHKVIGFDNLSNTSIDPSSRIKQSTGANWRNFSFFSADVRILDTMLMITRQEDIQAVVHLAALGSVPRSFLNPVATIDNNDKGFISTLQLASQLKVKRFIYASSSSVYGRTKYPIRTEGQTLAPASPYAVSKLQNEMIAAVWGEPAGIEMIGLRFFNVYGPGQRVDSDYAAVIPKFINAKKPVVYGDGTTTRDFTFVEDVCEAITLSLVCPKFNFVCNIGTGSGTSLDHLLDVIGRKKEAIYERERLGDVKKSIADCSRAKAMLGFEAKTTLNEGIRKTMAYYESLFKEPENQTGK